MSTPIKVLYLENAIGWGGAAICLKLIAKYLDRNRFYPIITTPHDDEHYRSYGDVSEWIYIRDRVVNARNMKKLLPAPPASAVDYALNLLPYTYRLYRVAKTKGVDIIHANNEPVCNMAGILAAKMLKIPCICHVRGPTEWKSATSRWLYGKVDYYITVADWVRDNVMGMGVPGERIRTIWDGRELDQFEKIINPEEVRRNLGLEEGEISIGIVGRLNPWKGHRVFLEAAALVGERTPECKLFIIGGSSETYRDYETELKGEARGKGLKNVIFTGQRDDIPDVMRVLDILVHASLEPDPYPNVVLEGMVAGKPVIASNIGGPLEMIDDYVTGILIEPSDPELLADKICELAADPELRLKIGIEARKIALERYPIRNHVRQIEALYENILNP